MLKRFAAVLTVVSVSWLGCESRVVAIRSPTSSDGGQDASVECVDFEVDVQRVLTNVGLAAGPQGVAFAGLESFGGGVALNFFVVLGDGGVAHTAAFDGGVESLVSVVAATDGSGFAAAFHRGGVPTLARFDLAGRPLNDPVSVLAPGLGGAPPWGLRVSSHQGAFAVVYRGMGATPGYGVQAADGTLRLHGDTFTTGHVDGLLESDHVAFVAHDSALNAQELLSWHEPLGGADGGPTFTTLFTGSLLGKPVVCPSLVLFGTSDAGVAEVQAVRLAPLSTATVVGEARAQNPRFLNADCTATGAVVAFRLPTGELQVTEVTGSVVQPRFTVNDVLGSTDFSVAARGRELWLLSTSAATHTTHLTRRCTPQ